MPPPSATARSHAQPSPPLHPSLCNLPVQLEVSFSSLAELEEFWISIPAVEHKAWGQRMQQYIVHGSPQWQVYRCLPAFPVEAAPAAAAVGVTAGTGRRRSGPAAAPRPSSSSGSSSSSSGATSSGGLLMASDEEIGKYADGAAMPAAAAAGEQTPSGSPVVSGNDEAQTVLDWKGDPMTINPGDKLPFKFF